jgi:hypothetical protein
MSTNTAIGARPGESVRHTSSQLYLRAGRRGVWALLLVIFGIAVAARGGPAVGLLLAGCGVWVAIRAYRLQGAASRYKLGAEAEERVGALLERLSSEGWLVEHDVAKRGGGNVDHVVHSPSVTFTIDTKRSAWHGPDLGQAHRHVAWAATHYGARRLIVPVICVQRSSRGAEAIDGVYVIGAGKLLAFLHERG